MILPLLLVSLDFVARPMPAGGPVWSAVDALYANRPEEAVRLLENYCPALADDGERGYCLLIEGMGLQGAKRYREAAPAFARSAELMKKDGSPVYRTPLSMAYRYRGILLGSELLLLKALALQDGELAASTRGRLAELRKVLRAR